MLIASGCGKTPDPAPAGACSGYAAVGTWLETTQPDTLTIKSDCTGTSTFCAYQFTWEVGPTIPDNKIHVVVTSSNNASQCMAVGTNHYCTFDPTTNGYRVVKCDSFPTNYYHQ